MRCIMSFKFRMPQGQLQRAKQKECLPRRKDERHSGTTLLQFNQIGHKLREDIVVAAVHGFCHSIRPSLSATCNGCVAYLSKNPRHTADLRVYAVSWHTMQLRSLTAASTICFTWPGVRCMRLPGRKMHVEHCSESTWIRPLR